MNHIASEYFVSHLDRVMVIHHTSYGKGKLEFALDVVTSFKAVSGASYDLLTK